MKKILLGSSSRDIAPSPLSIRRAAIGGTRIYTGLSGRARQAHTHTHAPTHAHPRTQCVCIHASAGERRRTGTPAHLQACPYEQCGYTRVCVTRAHITRETEKTVKPLRQQRFGDFPPCEHSFSVLR